MQNTWTNSNKGPRLKLQILSLRNLFNFSLFADLSDERLNNFFQGMSNFLSAIKLSKYLHKSSLVACTKKKFVKYFVTIVTFSEKKQIRRSICFLSWLVVVLLNNKASICSLHLFTKTLSLLITEPVSYRGWCFGSTHGHFLCNFWYNFTYNLVFHICLKDSSQKYIISSRTF